MKRPSSAWMARVSVLCIIGATLISCRTTAGKDSMGGKGSGLASVDGEGDYCVALRGNGDRINGLVNALAGTVEHYGMPMALAGGSSGSITAFLYESMTQNPSVLASPTPTDKALRVSFLLKSVWAYVEMVGYAEEGLAMKGLLLWSLSPNPIAAVKQTLAQSTLGSVFNVKEVEKMLQDPVHRKDLEDQIKGFGKWDSSNPKIFFQPGLIDFSQLAHKLGRLGDLYAGRGAFYDEAAMGNLLRMCAEPAMGKAWDAAAGLRMTNLEGGATTCGAEFLRIAAAYRKKHIDEEGHLSFVSRVDDPIGAYVPTLVATSVTKDPEFIAGYKTSLDNYWNNRPLDFHPDFSKLRMGYWGSREDLETVAKNTEGFQDEKTSRFENLLDGRPGASWHEVLRVSPAEPGLVAAQFILPDTSLSFGGWSDLQPTLVLRNLGCKEVMFLTRRSPQEAVFAQGVAKLLGMDGPNAGMKARIFDYNVGENPVSSAVLSHQKASGIWCTNWDKIETLPAPPLAQDGYRAPLIAHSEFFKTFHLPGVPLYDNFAQPSPDLPGCSIQ